MGTGDGCGSGSARLQAVGVLCVTHKRVDVDEVAVCRFGCVCKARSGVGVKA